MPGNFGCVDSGIYLYSGQRVTFVASGVTNTWGGTPSSNGEPNGQGQAICNDPKCAMSGVGYGTLVGKIDYGQPFRVGGSFEFSAPTAGRLYLAMNDFYYQDNLGAYNVTITIR